MKVAASLPNLALKGIKPLLERQVEDAQTKIKIENDKITNLETLLEINSLSREDFKRVLCINLDKICRVLHTDVNNSCFSLTCIAHETE